MSVCSKCGWISGLLVATSVAAHAVDEGGAFVRKQLSQEVQHLASKDLQGDGNEQIAIIKHDKQARYAVQLVAGTRYAIAAACDQDCGHVHIALQNPENTIVMQSPETEQVVIIGGTPDRSGGYVIELTVPGCRTRVCHAGFEVMKESGKLVAATNPIRLDPDTTSVAARDSKKEPDVQKPQIKAVRKERVATKSDDKPRFSCQHVYGIGRPCFRVRQ